MSATARMFLLAAAVASTAGVVGCASPTPSGTPSDLPVMPPTGVISSRDFVRLFAENCVRHFPDNQAMARAYLADGFTEHERTRGMGALGEWHLERPADKLGAQIGQVVIVEKASLNFVGNGLGGFYACSLTGQVSDPAAFDAEVLGMIDIHGQPFAWQASGDELNVMIDRDGTAATLEANPPSLNFALGTPDNLPSSCGGLTDCRVWGQAEMSIWVPADVIAAQQQ